MAPSRLERLNMLLGSEDRPPLPDPATLHIADQDLLPASDTRPVFSSSTTASYPRTIPKPAPPPPDRRDIDQISSSDDDEYVAAFKESSRPKIDLQPAQKTVKNKKKKKGTSASSQSAARTYDESSVTTIAGHAPARSRSSSTSSTYSEHGTVTGTFCPLVLASKFPYKYLRTDTSDKVAKRFFDEGKFWRRPWKIYYIHPPASVSHKVLLLIPESQFQELVEEINKAFKSTLAMPSDPDLGFVLSFFDNGTPRPTYLGVSHNRVDISDMESTVPPPQDGDGEAPAGASREVTRSFAAYKKKMEKSVQATKNKSVALKKKKIETRILQQQDWIKSLKRAQRYVGLRPKAQPIRTIPGVDADRSVEREEAAQHERKLLETDNLSISQPVPHPFDNKVVFVCIDVESYERDHRQITEIGVSTLDTRDLIEIAPGQDGKNWMTQIRSRHFRITERAHLINTDFVKGSPDRFEFGTSEWVSVQDAPRLVDSCFQQPFSMAFKYEGPGKQSNAFLKNANSAQPNEDLAAKEPVDTKGPSNESQAAANQVAVEKVISHLSGEKTSSNTRDQRVDSVDHCDLSFAGIDNKTQESNGLQASRATNKSSADEPGSAEASVPQKKEETNIPPNQGRNELEDGDIRSVGASPHDLTTRNIVLLGHDTPSDISYLRQLGCTVFEKAGEIFPTLLEALDTATLYKVFRKENNPRSLGHLLVEFGIEGWNLHNAGNDARYTLELMISILLRARLEESANHLEAKSQRKKGATTGWEEEVERRVNASISETEVRVREECESWLVAAGVKGPTATKLKSTASDEEVNIRFTTDDIDGGEAVGVNVDPVGRKQKQPSKDRAQLDEWRKEGHVYAANGEGLEPDEEASVPIAKAQDPDDRW